jgi:propionyl-CoA synthetase
VRLVRERLGAVASMKQVLIIKRLPKTRSGKVLRKTMRKIADGESYTTPATIDDPAILGEIEAVLGAAGFPGS